MNRVVFWRCCAFLLGIGKVTVFGTFLQDGDTVTLRAVCAAPGVARLGLGEVCGTIKG